jgi:hypothetical protein
MKKIVMCLMIVMMMVGSAFGEVDTRGLTEEQQATLQLQAAQMKNGGNDLTNPKKVNEWVNVGDNISTALITAAEKLGIAADKFIDSKTGKLIVVLIVWKVMGGAIVHIAGGAIFWIVSTFILWMVFRKTCVYDTIEYTNVEGKLFRNKKINYISPNQVEGERLVLMLLWCLVNLVTIMVVLNF